jgi:hypothetical protein
MTADGCLLYRLDTGEDRSLDLAPGCRVVIGRSVTSTVVLGGDDVSRTAATLDIDRDRVVFRCTQTYGSLTVNRDDGSPAATLKSGEELRVASGTWAFSLRAGRRPALVATLDLARAYTPALRQPGRITVGAWRLSDVLKPTEATEWQTLTVLAAMAAATARSDTLRPRQSLQLMVDAWFDHRFEPGGALSRRLDGALREMGVRSRPGIDKVPLLAEAFGNSGVLTEPELARVRTELATRADRHLTASRRRLLRLP